MINPTEKEWCSYLINTISEISRMGQCKGMGFGRIISSKNMLEVGKIIKPMGMVSILPKKVITKVFI